MFFFRPHFDMSISARTRLPDTGEKSYTEKLNKHFVSIGKNLADKIQTNDNNLFSKLLNQKVASSMFLQPPRHSKVFNIIHSLRLQKSSGHDNID